MNYEIYLKDNSENADSTEPIKLLETDDETEKSKWVVQIGALKNKRTPGAEVSIEVVHSEIRSIESGKVFKNVVEANKALGFHYDRLSTSFSNAKAYGRNIITVRGVTLKKKTA